MNDLSMAGAFGWEFIGTAALLLFGNGVCAANTLRTSAARNTGWLLIALGWGMAVFIGASIASRTGGQLNPAVTLCLALRGDIEWRFVPAHIAGQMAGAIAGAVLTWLAYKQLFDANNLDEDGNITHANRSTGGIFFTAGAGPNNIWNAVTEFIATAALLAFIIWNPGGVELGSLTYFAVAFVIIGIGLSLGTPTGYALNPARDLGPRLAYAFLLPIKDKGSAQWGYAWVPIVAPMLAGLVMGLV